MQTQHSVDWKVSMWERWGCMGSGGADAAVDENEAGGADGTFSCGGAVGYSPGTPFVCPYLAANFSCWAAYSPTHTNNFCLKYVLCMPI